MTNETAGIAEKNEVLITRIINAPRQLVYDCWTQAEHLKRWYAPNNCTCLFTKIDIKIGSGYHGAIIHSDDGRRNWFYAVFKEIDPPKKLVFTLARADEHGNHLSPRDAGMPHEWPDITVVTLTFEDLDPGKQTKFTLHQTVDLDLATRIGAYPSWLQMLDRLETLIVK
ncbi:MAG TPA: SRPBCC domain-containing protein [Puia sp.]|nr:SRPBCC domain-containing protein [Puia sp.]